MMIRLLLWVSFVAVFASAIDHDIFKNCSRVPFCSRLRNAVLEQQGLFQANLNDVAVVDGVTRIPLNNSLGQSLLLSVTYHDSVVRLRIAEPDTKRYQLEEGQSLVAEPPIRGFFKTERSEDNKKLTLHAEDSEYRVEFTSGPPFVVSFYDGESRLLSTLNGDSLIMENTEESQAFSFRVNFTAEKLYGLFEHAWKLALGDTADIDPFRMFNCEAYGYEANSPMALFGAHPIIYGHTAELTHGIFLHNAAEQWIDISYDSPTPSAYFIVEGGLLDVFVLLGPTPKDVVRQITGLTGKPHLPQLWSLGYQQSRYSYASDDEVKEVANLMVQNNIPMDAIWIDGDHTDDYRWFQWNHTTYTDPIEMFNNLSSINKVAVSISDPHIKVDDDYKVYVGAEGKYFVKWANGSDYQADCFPGLSSWIDFFVPEASDYYGTWYYYENFDGTNPTLAGIWNDLNEPTVFVDELEQTLPFETIHRLDLEGNRTVRHGEVHNLYGLMHVKATHKGLLARDNYRKRPFILSRSTFAGSQRVTAMWTGDNVASWEHFANSLSQCMTGNLLGMAFCGADIGGFIGDPSDELLQRWYQGAVWYPFFRGHSGKDCKRREPYLFSEEVTGVIRDAIELRYKHIPYLYTLFYQHTVTGDPIISPLFYHYPGIQERDTQMLVGRDVMAIGVVNESVSSVEVLFPGETEVWYRVDNGTEWTVYYGQNVEEVEVDILTSPVFYRGGSVIPRKDIFRLSTFDAANDPFTLYINLDLDNKANGLFYFDDFESFDYLNEDAHLYWQLSYVNETDSIHIHEISGQLDEYDISFSTVVVHSVEQSTTTGARNKVVKRVYTTTKDGKPFRFGNGVGLARDQSHYVLDL